MYIQVLWVCCTTKRPVDGGAVTDYCLSLIHREPSLKFVLCFCVVKVFCPTV